MMPADITMQCEIGLAVGNSLIMKVWVLNAYYTCNLYCALPITA